MGGYGSIHTALAYPDRFSACVALSSALVIKAAAANHGCKVDGVDPKVIDHELNILPEKMTWELFGNPSLLVDSDKNPEVQYKKLKDTGAEIPKIYLAVGTEDALLEANRDFVRFLDKEGADYKYEEGPGKHDWFFWNEYLERGLKYVLG